MNKQSNLYTVIYIIVMVVLVGSALAYTSISLRDRQNDNIAADKMRQILASINLTPEKGDIISEFNKTITSQYLVNSRGEKVEGNAFDTDVASQIRLAPEARILPVFEATLDGNTKYILPVYGAGLWGPIWGYVALDADATTIYGAYFAHQGETPGLGAEITRPFFSKQFEGKHLFKGDTFMPVAVVKKGQHPAGDEDYVDGISGGTITSKGVGEMLDNCLRPYASFLDNIRKR